MKELRIGDVTITSIVERDGPWRTPESMFPAYDPALGARHLAEMDPVVFDAASGRMVITYQTFVVRTPKHTILVDTCTGEDKGYPPPMDFPKQPWLDGFAAAGLRFEIGVAPVNGRMVPVATLEIGERLADAANGVTFNPWNTGGGMQPTGPINRMREWVYDRSQAGWQPAGD